MGEQFHETRSGLLISNRERILSVEEANDPNRDRNFRFRRIRDPNEQAPLADAWQTITSRNWVGHLIIENTFVSLMWFTVLGTMIFFGVPGGLPMLLISIAGVITNALFQSIALNLEQRFPLIRNAVNDLADTLGTSISRNTSRVTESISTGLANASNAIYGDGTSWKSIIANAQSHPAGMAAVASIVSKADSPRTVVESTIVTASLLGLERSIFHSVVGKLGQAVFGDGQTVTTNTNEGEEVAPATDPLPLEAQADDMTSKFSEFITQKGSRKAASLIATAASVAGMSITGQDFMKPMKLATANQKAIQELWTSVEDFLNDTGLISTGKHALLDELTRLFDNIREDFEAIQTQIVTEPSIFCKPREWNRYQIFKGKLKNLNDLLIRNKEGDLKKTSLFTNVNLLLTKTTGWDETLAHVRRTQGYRPVPVGVCLKGPSQIGKTFLVGEMQKRIANILRERHLSAPQDPRLMAFSDAHEWTRWTVQQRDEYDQGYTGQEVTYVDDGFSDKEHKDHPMFLTFISGEAIGTVQANLSQKGMPYQSRIVFVTSNSLPEHSVTINNINALQERFPWTILCRLKNGYKTKTSRDKYDNEFKHLEFHVAPMKSSCALRNDKTGCAWSKDGAASSLCSSRNLNLNEICNLIADDIISYEEKYMTQVMAFQAQSENDDVLDDDVEDVDESEFNSSAGSEVSDSELEEEVANTEPSSSEKEEEEEIEVIQATPAKEPEPIIPQPKIVEYTEPVAGPSNIGLETIEEIPEPETPRVANLDRFQPFLQTGAKNNNLDPRLVSQDNINEMLEKGTSWGLKVKPVFSQKPPIIKEEIRIHSLVPGDPSHPTQRKLYLQILNSYRMPALEQISNVKIIGWLQYMYAPKNEYAINYCERNNITHAWHLLKVLDTFEVKPKDMKVFVRAWKHCFKDGIRVNDFDNEQGYYMSTDIDGGRTAIKVPYSLDTIEEFDLEGRHQSFKLILREVTRNLKLTKVKNTSYYIWMARNPYHDRSPLERTIEVGLPLKILHWVGTPLSVHFLTNLAYAARHAGYTAETFAIAQKVERFCLRYARSWTRSVECIVTPFRYVDWISGGTLSLINKVGECLKWFKNFVSYCLMRLTDIVGIPLSETIEYISDIFTTGAVASVAAVIIGVMSLFLYLLVKWLFGKLLKIGKAAKSTVKRWGKAMADTIDDEEKDDEEERPSFKTVAKRARAESKTNNSKRVMRTKIVRANTARKVMAEADEDERKKEISLTPLINAEGYKKHVLATAQALFANECSFCSDSCRPIWFDKDAEYAVVDKIFSGEEIYACIQEDHNVPNPLKEGTLESELLAALNFVKTKDWEYFTLWRGFGERAEVSFHHGAILISPDDQSDLKELVDPPKNFSINRVERLRCGEAWEIIIHGVMPWSDIQTFETVLHPLMRSLGYPSFDVYFSGNNQWAVYTFSCLSSFNGKQEGIITKTKMKECRPILDDLAGLGAEFTWYELIDGELLPLQDIKVAEGQDDAAIDLLKLIGEEHSVYIVAPAGSHKDYLEQFDSLGGLSCNGLAFENYVLAPYHMADKGEYVKVFRTRRHNMYGVYQCKAVDKVMHLSLLEFIPPKKFLESMTPILNRKLTFSDYVYLDRMFPMNFGTWIWKHINTTEELGKISTFSQDGVQYLPKSGITVTCNYQLQGKQSVRWISKRAGKHVETREMLRVLAVSYLSTDTASITRNGDCGGPLLALNSRVAKKLIGMHVLGGESSAFCSIITSDVLKDLISLASEFEVYQSQADDQVQCYLDNTDLSKLSYKDNDIGGLGHYQWSVWPRILFADAKDDPFRSFILKEKYPIDAPVGKCARAVGFLNYDHRCVGQSAEKWKRSPFYGCFPITHHPSILSANDPRLEVELPTNRIGEPTLLWPNDVLATELPECDVDLLTACTDQLINYFSVILGSKTLGVHTTDLDTILDYGINGIPYGKYMNGIVTDSSAGIPWNSKIGESKKSDLIGIDENGKRFFRSGDQSELLIRVCKNKLTQARNGKRVTTFYASKLKDCLVKEKHVKSGKTRVFNAAPIESVICGNALFGPFKEAFRGHPFELCHSLGIDVNSQDWHLLWCHLKTFDNCYDVDYSQYDKHLKSSFMRASKIVQIETIHKVDPDDWRIARYVIAEDDITSFMVDNRSVYWSEHSNKSGTHITTEDNSICNFLMFFYCWSKHFGIVDLSHLMTHVRFSTLGDDKIDSISDEARAGGWNRNRYFELLAEFGQEATGADKGDGELAPFGEWETTQFLKGTTVDIRGLYVYALEKESILATFGFTKLTSSDTDAWCQIVRSHLESSIPHGREFFNYVLDALRERTRLRSFPRHLRRALAPYLSTSFEEAQTKLIAKVGSVEVTVQSDPSPAQFREWVDSEGGSLYGALASLRLVDQGIKIEQVEKDVKTLFNTTDQLALLLQDVRRVAETAYTQSTSNASDITSMKRNITEIQEVIDNLPSDLGTLAQRVTTLETTTALMEESLELVHDTTTVHTEQITLLSSIVGDLDEELTNTSSKLDDLTDVVKIVKADVSANANAIVQLLSTTNQLGADINSLRFSVELLTDRDWTITTLNDPDWTFSVTTSAISGDKLVFDRYIGDSGNDGLKQGEGGAKFIGKVSFPPYRNTVYIAGMYLVPKPYTKLIPNFKLNLGSSYPFKWTTGGSGWIDNEDHKYSLELTCERRTKRSSLTPSWDEDKSTKKLCNDGQAPFNDIHPSARLDAQPAELA